MDYWDPECLYRLRNNFFVSPFHLLPLETVLKNDLLLHEAVIKNEADAVRKVLRETVDVDSRNNVSMISVFRHRKHQVIIRVRFCDDFMGFSTDVLQFTGQHLEETQR